MMIPETLYKANTKFLRAIFFSAANSFKPEYDQIINVFDAPDKRPFFEDLSLAEFGVAPEKIAANPVVFDTIREAYSVKYVYITVALGFRASKELLYHDQYGIMSKLTQLLQFSLQEAREIRFWNILNLAFSANVLGGDGKSLCATDHPLKKGGSYANMVASTAFSTTAYQNAKIRFKKVKADSGLPSAKTPKFLVGPLELDEKFQQILKSEKEPYTTDNQINIHFNDKVTPITSKRITSTTQWNLLADKANISNGKLQFSPNAHQLNVAFVWKNNFKSDWDLKTLSTETIADERYGYGFSDWRGVDGSQGA